MYYLNKERAEWAKKRIQNIKDKYGELNFDPEVAKKAMEEVHFTVTISQDSALMRRCEICKNHLNFEKIEKSFPPGALRCRCCNVHYSIWPKVVDSKSVYGGVVNFQTLLPITDDVWERSYYFRHIDQECPLCNTNTILRMNASVSFEEICTNDGCHYWYGLMGG